MSELNETPVAEDRLEKLESTVSQLESENIESAIERVVSKLAEGEPTTPSKRVVGERITVRDRFDRAGFTEADFATAALMESAVRALKPDFRLPEDLANRIRAMSASGNPEWVGETFVTELWESIRNEDSIVDSIPAIPMPTATLHVPVDTTLPVTYYVSESTADNASAYPTSDAGTGRRSLQAKKFTIQTVVSGEMTEDSMVPFIPVLRSKLVKSAAIHLGSAMLNGDTATGTAANINAGNTGQTPSTNAHYLAFDGIRKYAIANNKLAAATADLVADIAKIRKFLSGQSKAVDPGLANVTNWGRNPRDLRIVCDFETYLKLVQDSKVITVDKYGPNATIVTGELGSVLGIPVVVPPYCTPTLPNASAKVSKVASENTVGQIVLFAPGAFLRGIRRDVQLFADRIQRTDQLLFELYLRVGFERHGENVAAIVRDVSLA